MDLKINISKFYFSIDIQFIDYCLTSSEQYFSYIQDENRSNNIWQLYINEGKDGSTTFDCHRKDKEFDRVAKCCSGNTAPTLFSKSTKEV